MRLYLFLSFICHFYQGTSTKIKPERKKNILNFGYGINYKYEGMLAHSFNRFYVVTKFTLPSIGDLKLSKLKYDNACAYLDNRSTQTTETRKHMLDLMTFCKKTEPFLMYYKRLMKSYNHMAHNISENEIKIILPQVPKKQKHGIITTLVSSFIGLAYEGIPSFLHHMGNKALHKAVKAMDNRATIQCNNLMQLENSLLMYGVYNADTLEELINTVYKIHNTTSSHERLFAGQHSFLTLKSLYAYSLGVHHSSINSLLYLRTIQEKYIVLHRELISQLCIYTSMIRIFQKDIYQIL